MLWVARGEGVGKGASFLWLGLALGALSTLGRLPGLQLWASSPTLNCS